MIELVESIDQYNNLLNEAKKNIITPVSNNHLFAEAMVDYIDQGMLYYSFDSSGLRLYIKQRNYYTCYFVLEKQCMPEFDKLDMPIYAYILRTKKDQSFYAVQDKLLEAGFSHHETRKGFDYSPEEVYNITLRVADFARSLLEKRGFTISIPNPEHYSELLDFVNSIDEIPFWQLDFPTYELFLKEIESERIKCVFDSNKAIVGMYYRLRVGKYEYGYIAIEKQYRDSGAMAVALTNERMKGIIEQEGKGRAWISTNNVKSLKYHESLGCIANGRYKEEFLLE